MLLFSVSETVLSSHFVLSEVGAARLLGGGCSLDLPYVIYVVCLFVISVISHFGVGARFWCRLYQFRGTDFLLL